MWRWILVMGCSISLTLHAQKKWDGGAGTAHWNDEANWFPDGLPLTTDDVLLDNSFISGSYTVLLPNGPFSLSLSTLTLAPASGGAITLELPAGNSANPGLGLRDLRIGPGAVFINASGATAGSGLAVTGTLLIQDGGTYIHRTPRSNASIIDRLLIQPGSEKGIFAFDVPGTAGYTVSLTGNQFGSLSFRAAAAGGAKSYSGSGIGTLTIHGDLQVETGANLTSTLSADIIVRGNLQVDGRLSLNPSTAGTVARSLRFDGYGSYRGTGTLAMNANFRNIEISPGASLSLQRPLSLPLATHALLVRGSLSLGPHGMDGAGLFILADSAVLRMGDPSGISASDQIGNVRTATRSFSNKATYIYDGASAQLTGDGLPDSISALGINNPAGLTLSKPVYIRDSLLLTLGLVRSSYGTLPTLGNPAIHSTANRYGQVNQGHAQSFVSGPMALHLMTDALFIAPLGTDTIFAPVAFTLQDPGREKLVVEYKASAPPDSMASPLIHWLSNREYWQLQQPASAQIRHRISLRPWSLPEQPQTKPALAAAQARWEKLSGNIAGGGYRWLVADTALTGTSALAPALELEGGLLPVGILSFSAQDDPEGVRLSWEAEEDGRSLVYRILKSPNGLDLRETARIRSAGRGRVRHVWTDRNPLPLAYYQLHMLAGNSVSVSRTIRKQTPKRYVRVYPNPAHDEIHIFFPGSSSRYEVAVVSLTGTVCKKFVCNTADSQMRVGDLKKGFYLLRITDQNGSITLPFTKD